MSVDVEEYFQVSAFEGIVPRDAWKQMESRVVKSTMRLLEVFDQSQVMATFFTLGWIGEHHPELVVEIQKAGHEVALHGYDHRRVTTLSREEFRADLQKSKRILEDITGTPVLGYRAPSFSIVQETAWALDILVEEGIRYDSSVFPIRHDRYGWPGSPRFPWKVTTNTEVDIIEFPISTVRILGVKLPFVGGGYLRHFPMPYIRWGIRQVNEVEGRPVVVFLHPWEIDPDQPRQPAGFLTSLRHYRNIDQTEDRLRSLLSEFDFGSMARAVGFSA